MGATTASVRSHVNANPTASITYRTEPTDVFGAGGSGPDTASSGALS